ncbi:hypothetical protein B9Z55_017377 [Caenorhabditis nigoni]|nr:hypothetical protein B9Z55_017377 [Caenorhabditis nigoni]
MLGIAISDIVNLSYLIYQFIGTISESFNDECTVPQSSLITRLIWYAMIIKDDSRRLSTWLGVLMASLRYLIMKNALNPTFDFLSKPSSGWKSLATAFTISSLMSLFSLVRVDLISVVWVPPETCGYPTNFSMLAYGYATNDAFFSGAEIYNSFLFIDGVLKIIPAILLPILAALLIRELRKARKKVSASSQSNSDSTSKMVIIITITCICAEGPMGTSFVIEGLVNNVRTLRDMVIWFESIIQTFVILNATTHCFVCLRVSTPYRKAVKELLRYKESQKPITMNQKIGSASTVTQRQEDARIDG